MTILKMMVLVMGLILIQSCGNDGQSSETESQEQEQVVHGEGKEYNSAYVCPMHCEGSGSEEPGKCPVCGMDYVALADHTENDHEH